ncbi:MAG: hypothetical protein WAT66_01805 [Actinomycetota bacterium]
MKRFRTARRVTRVLVVLLAVLASASLGAGVYTFAAAKSGPPTPAFTQVPPDPSPSTEATFAWTDAATNVTFQCSLDNGAWQSCTSPGTISVATTGNGQHQFAVRAVDSTGKTSGNATYSWKVNKIGFTFSGSVLGLLTPGAWKPIAITITNPNNWTIYVTALNASVTSSPSTCPGSTNIEFIQSPISASHTVAVPANGTAPIPLADRPQIRLKNLPVNQNACQGASFGLLYTGTATK